MAAAYNAGALIVAASGNDNVAVIHYPAGYTVVLAVGATGYGNTIAPYSNRGARLDVVAPGGNASVDANADGYGDGVLQETQVGGKWSYYFYEGTSMATPQVAAAAALLMSKGATNAEAERVLKSTAKDLGAAGLDTTYGHGLIQPYAALNAYLASPACDFSGTVSAGSRYHTIGTLALGTVVNRRLTWTTTSANLDLYLETAPVGSAAWVMASRSNVATPGVAEQVVYTIPARQAGYQFRWNVARRSGASAYCLGR